MSYQVLARKWRPKNFSQLMGQEHVVTILANALSQNRLHHAYLFTGTRGVGKTTIARIFAKSLNCVEGITSEPCGKCDVCLDIDQGHFVDLLEIDAASRTKVDDTREILENVQYAPSRGRYKVYLIDEVHMLSRSSFNALLKTLEEPPEHVKFILATTDPQKLPITVLSRCLQFHLKALTVNQIERKLIEILNAEQVTFNEGAITLLAKAARGSMRDSLSLTDQAIAQGQGTIELANVQQMLGGIDQNWPYKILIALIKQDAQQLMQLSQEIASYAPSYSRLFAELIQLLHQVAMHQVVAHDFNLSKEHLELLKKFAQAMSAEDIQLYYQIALNGRKDLPYAGDEQAAFDMTLLRLLAFKPVTHGSQLPEAEPVAQAVVSFDEDNLTESTVTAALASSELGKSEHQSAVQEPPEQSLPEELLPEELSTPSISEQPIVDTHINDVENSESEGNNIEDNDANVNDVSRDQLADEMLAIEQESQHLHTAAQDSVQHSSAQQPSLPNSTVQTSEELPSTSVLEEQAPDDLLTNVSDSVASENVNRTEHTVDATNSGDEAQAEESNVPPLVEENVPSEILAQVDSPIGDVLKQRNLLRSRKKQQESSAKKSSDAQERQPSVAEIQQAKAQEIPDIDSIPEQPFSPEIIDPSSIKKANQVDKWANMIDAMALNGRLRQLAIQATIDPQSNDEYLVLNLNQKTKHLKTDAAHQQLQAFVSHYFAKPMQVEINIVEETVDDPYQIQSHINDKRYEYAKQLLRDDELVQQMQTLFQAELDESTVVAK